MSPEIELGCVKCKAPDGNLLGRRNVFHGGLALDSVVDFDDDCASSFQSIHDYFHADLGRCPHCNTTWLRGYYEIFADVLDEWGERIFIYRPLTDAHAKEVHAQKGTQSLDIKTFGM